MASCACIECIAYTRYVKVNKTLYIMRQCISVLRSKVHYSCLMNYLSQPLQMEGKQPNYRLNMMERQSQKKSSQNILCFSSSLFNIQSTLPPRGQDSHCLEVENSSYNMAEMMECQSQTKFSPKSTQSQTQKCYLDSLILPTTYCPSPSAMI